MSFTCPRCGMISQHPTDETEGYCARCKEFTADEPRTVLMHPALVPAFDAWLASRGLECRPAVKIREDDPAIAWIVTPDDRTMGLPRSSP